MCKYDEAFTEEEMKEETGFCSVCPIKECKNKGEVNDDKRTVL